MSAQNRTTLKGYFNTGDKPTETQFTNLIDSGLNLTDGGTVAGATAFSGFATANAVGGGFDGAETCTVTVGNFNGTIITKIVVDITGLLVSGTVKDVIGEDGVAAAYMTQVTTAVNGIVYAADIACLETPAGSNTEADIDLVTSSNSLAEDALYDSGTTEVALCPAGADYVAGMFTRSASGLDCNNISANSHYIYLADGSGAASGGTYTAGKFIINLYGHAV